MLRLKPRQRSALGETVRELANLVAGALVLSQFVGLQAFSLWLVCAGVAVWFLLVGFALMLIGKPQ